MVPLQQKSREAIGAAYSEGSRATTRHIRSICNGQDRPPADRVSCEPRQRAAEADCNHRPSNWPGADQRPVRPIPAPRPTGTVHTGSTRGPYAAAFRLGGSETGPAKLEIGRPRPPCQQKASHHSVLSVLAFVILEPEHSANARKPTPDRGRRHGAQNPPQHRQGDQGGQQQRRGEGKAAYHDAPRSFGANGFCKTRPTPLQGRGPGPCKALANLLQEIWTVPLIRAPFRWRGKATTAWAPPHRRCGGRW